MYEFLRWYFCGYEHAGLRKPLGFWPNITISTYNFLSMLHRPEKRVLWIVFGGGGVSTKYSYLVLFDAAEASGDVHVCADSYEGRPKQLKWATAGR